MHQTTNKQTPVLDSCKDINISPIWFITVGAHGLIIPPKPLNFHLDLYQYSIFQNYSSQLWLPAQCAFRVQIIANLVLSSAWSLNTNPLPEVFQADIPQIPRGNVSAKNLPKCSDLGFSLLRSHVLLLPPYWQSPTRPPPIMLEHHLTKESSGGLPLGNV